MAFMLRTIYGDSGTLRAEITGHATRENILPATGGKMDTDGYLCFLGASTM